MKKILLTYLAITLCACSSNNEQAKPQEIAPIKVIENTYKAKEQNIQKDIEINIPPLRIEDENMNLPAIEPQASAPEIKIEKTPEELELDSLIEGIVSNPPEYDKFEQKTNVAALFLPLSGERSEERRVGKEC